MGSSVAKRPGAATGDFDMASQLIYIDGQFYPKEEAKVSVFDHGLLYGDGVFEGIRAYGGRVFRLKEHVARLYSGAKTIMLDIPLSQEEMIAAVCESFRVNGLSDGYCRLVVTRGIGDLGLDPRKCPVPTVIIIADQITLYPPEYYDNGLNVITCATRRVSPQALDPALKPLNYLNNIMAKIETTQAGVPEGIMLSSEGYVSECTGDNLFLVEKGELVTPPLYIGNLAGITRQAIIDVAREQGIAVHEDLFRMHRVYNADEVFLTGTAAEVVPVVKVDGRSIGDGRPGPLTGKLWNLFTELTAHDGEPIEG